jgi:hypothetical protein
MAPWKFPGCCAFPSMHDVNAEGGLEGSKVCFLLDCKKFMKQNVQGRFLESHLLGGCAHEVTQVCF